MIALLAALVKKKTIFILNTTIHTDVIILIMLNTGYLYIDTTHGISIK